MDLKKEDITGFIHSSICKYKEITPSILVPCLVTRHTKYLASHESLSLLYYSEQYNQIKVNGII